MKKLDKKVNLSVFIARSIFSLFFYAGYIIIIILPKTVFEEPIIKTILLIVGGVIIILLLISNFILPFFIYKIHGYELKASELLIHKGVLFRRTTYLPIKRIQHIEKHVGPIQMLFNLATVQLFTAGSQDNIIGLNNLVANELIDEVNEKLNKFLKEDIKDE